MSKIMVKDASKIFARGKEEVRALDHCNLGVESGDYIAIMGPSGSGKSTLLKSIASSLELTSGEILIDDINLSSLNDTNKSHLRSAKIGYIVQDFMLLEDETVYNNICLPLIYNKDSPKQEYKERAEQAAEILGITHLLKAKAKTLSGGESQRVAIARAICGDQNIILADEPTGALDTENRENIMKLFTKLNEELKKTIIVVTHDRYVAEWSDQIYMMKDGVLSVE